MFRDTAITLASRVAMLLLAGGATILLARWLGPEGRGVYSLLTSFATIATLIAGLGIGVGNTYWVSRHPRSAPSLTANSVVAGVVLGTAGGALGFLIYLLLPAPFAGVSAAQLCIALAAVPFALVGQLVASVALGQQRLRVYNTINLAQPAAVAAGVLLFVSVWASVDLALLIFSMSFVLMAAAALATSPAGLPWPGLDVRILKSVIAFGLKLQVGNVFQFVNYRIALFLLSAYATVVHVGHYSIAVFLAETLWQLTGSLAIVLLPRVASIPEAEAIDLTNVAARVGLSTTIVLGGLLAGASPLMVPFVFGQEFAPAVTPLLLLMPGIALFSVTNVIASYFTGRGRPQYNTLVAGVSLIVSIVAGMILVPRAGLAGAAVATTLSHLCSTSVTLALYRRSSASALRDTLLPRHGDLQLVVRPLRAIATAVSGRSIT